MQSASTWVKNGMKSFERLDWGQDRFKIIRGEKMLTWKVLLKESEFFKEVEDTRIQVS